ncbi:MAG: hypothetical protein KOO60_07355 [Gemmatimonadales bacterium]|nr:hypothetical protein [Gemmatimonadales bacterium]
MSDHECQRCGECCMGRGNLWTQANLPALFNSDAVRQQRREFGDCDMLGVDKEGEYTCLLEVIFGKAAKPEVCRDYPFDGEQCEREKMK